MQASPLGMLGLKFGTATGIDVCERRASLSVLHIKTAASTHRQALRTQLPLALKR